MEAALPFTAAGVVSIAAVRSPSGETVIADGRLRPVTVRLSGALAGLQQGGGQDPFGWRVAVGRTAPQTC